MNISKNYHKAMDYYSFHISRLAIHFSHITKPFVTIYVIYAIMCICTLFLQLDYVMDLKFNLILC